MSHRATNWRTAALIAVLLGAGRAGGAEPGLPDERLGLRTARLLLLSRADVRTDLGLDARQSSDTETAIADLYAQAAGLRGKQGAGVVAARREIDATMERWLEAHLTPEQFQRLGEIDLQWEGPSALISRPIVADRLGLSAEQRQNLERAVVERNRERTRRGFQPDVERQLGQKALTILTPDQRNRWKRLLGRPFEPRLTRAPTTAPR